jgi:hypothetical protein
MNTDERGSDPHPISTIPLYSYPLLSAFIPVHPCYLSEFSAINSLIRLYPHPPEIHLL